MCNPVAIGLALTAAGTAASAAGQRKAQKAMDGAREAERIRQKGYQSESDAVLDKSMANADKGSQDAQEAEAFAKRKGEADAATASVRAPVEATGENLAGDQTANTVINTENAAQAAKNLGYAGQQGGAKAKLLSFQDLNFANAIANARAAQDNARIAGFSRGSADVLPVEMEAASRKGDSLKTLGQGLSMAGTIAGLGAGAGWWGSPTAAAGAGTLGTAAGQQGAQLMGTTSTDLAFGRNMIPGLNPSQYTFGQLSAGIQDPSAFSNFLKAPVYATPYSIVPTSGGFKL